MVSAYSDIDLKNLVLAEKPSKVENVMVVPFDPSIKIQTDLVSATGPLVDENGDLLPNIHARASGAFLKFLKDFEASVLDVAKSHASSWWTKKQCTPAMVESGFKTYFKGEDIFKINVKSADQPLVFDEDGNEVGDESVTSSSRFWAVLEARRVVLGKTEFGMVWKLKQLMLKATAKCEVNPPRAQAGEDDGDFF